MFLSVIKRIKPFSVVNIFSIIESCVNGKGGDEEKKVCCTFFLILSPPSFFSKKSPPNPFFMEQPWKGLRLCIAGRCSHPKTAGDACDAVVKLLKTNASALLTDINLVGELFPVPSLVIDSRMPTCTTPTSPIVRLLELCNVVCADGEALDWDPELGFACKFMALAIEANVIDDIRLVLSEKCPQTPTERSWLFSPNKTPAAVAVASAIFCLGARRLPQYALEFLSFLLSAYASKRSNDITKYSEDDKASPRCVGLYMEEQAKNSFFINIIMQMAPYLAVWDPDTDALKNAAAKINDLCEQYNGGMTTKEKTVEYMKAASHTPACSCGVSWLEVLTQSSRDPDEYGTDMVCVCKAIGVPGCNFAFPKMK